LGINHRVDSGLVDFSRARAFFYLDQLSPAVGKHLEQDLHRFATCRMPEASDLTSPTPADEMADMLPVRLPLPWGGKRDQIFLS
jgi:hypothetical protein